MCLDSSPLIVVGLRAVPGRIWLIKASMDADDCQVSSPGYLPRGLDNESSALCEHERRDTGIAFSGYVGYSRPGEK